MRVYLVDWVQNTVKIPGGPCVRSRYIDYFFASCLVDAVRLWHERQYRRARILSVKEIVTKC